jgi:tRNA(Ile2) C34 agmatinyltransferase TiaS
MKLTIFNTGGYWLESEKRFFSSGITPSTSQENIDVIGIYEGQEASAKFWMLQFEKQNEQIKQIILSAYPNILDRINNENIIQPEMLYKYILRQLSKTELMPLCPRCGGTGEYSYNQRDGKRCFKCGGAKRILPKITNRWLKQVNEHFNK